MDLGTDARRLVVVAANSGSAGSTDLFTAEHLAVARRSNSLLAIREHVLCLASGFNGNRGHAAPEHVARERCRGGGASSAHSMAGSRASAGIHSGTAHATHIDVQFRAIGINGPHFRRAPCRADLAIRGAIAAVLGHTMVDTHAWALVQTSKLAISSPAPSIASGAASQSGQDARRRAQAVPYIGTAIAKFSTCTGADHAMGRRSNTKIATSKLAPSTACGKHGRSGTLARRLAAVAR